MQKKGLAFYQARVDMLESAVQQIKDASKNRTPRQTRPVRSTAAPGRKSRAAVFPQTGLEFWLQHIGKKPRSKLEIVTAAAETLKIDTEKDKETLKVLKNRLGPALEALVNSSRVTDTGSGRERRYFRK